MQSNKIGFFLKLTRVLIAVSAFLLVVSAAIAAPIVIRPFYYAQIKPLQLEQTTGYSQPVIREAYDDVMDYLVYGKEFGTGELAYSEEGKSHFEDCRTLFVLDFWVLGFSAVVLCLAALWNRRLQKTARGTLRVRHLPVFWSAVLSFGFFAALAIWGAVSFDSLFTAFHTVFFSGKSNWLFDPTEDEIINILPESFFLNCAILIVALIFVLNALFLILDSRFRKHNR